MCLLLKVMTTIQIVYSANRSDNMAQEARVIHLQKELISMQYYKALRALNWMISVMNADNDYKRHDGSHYYYHLVDATQDLINHGITDETVLTACILHDAIEDIEGVTQDSIAKDYGAEVALYVNGVTKKKDVNYKDPKNLQEYLEYILRFPQMALIKTADRKHNFSTLGNSNMAFELRQAKETDVHFLPFFKEARKRYPEFSAYFHSAKTTIVPHLKKIMKHHEDVERLKKNHEIELGKKDRRISELERIIKKLKGE